MLLAVDYSIYHFELLLLFIYLFIYLFKTIIIIKKYLVSKNLVSEKKKIFKYNKVLYDILTELLNFSI